MSSSNWIRPVVLAASCLVIGFVAGWTLATIGGDATALPEANLDVTVQKPAPSTTTVDAAPPPAPARDGVSVAVLNGTTTAGLAAATATQLRELGYANVTTGNTPPVTAESVVYFRDGSQPAAEQLAEDMKIETTTPVESTPFESTEGDLVLVLGPG